MSNNTNNKNIANLQKDLANYITSEVIIGNTSNRIIYPNGTPQTTLDETISDIDKKEHVINDPRFGMFSLYKYHITRGYNLSTGDNINKTGVYCSNIFTKYCFLPILTFLAQWFTYISIMVYEVRHYEEGFCPNNKSYETKVVMCCIATIYFIKSFFLWDDLVSRTHCKKVMPTNDIPVLFDTLQEFGFNLLVYLLNIFIVFVEEHPTNMLLDALAMEFVMDLDNQFKELYFKNIPNAAVDIYDNIFVSKNDNRIILKQKINEDRCFCCIKNLLMIPYKILIISLILFPIFCGCIIIYGPICK
jgi:hypothetical protein